MQGLALASHPAKPPALAQLQFAGMPMPQISEIEEAKESSAEKKALRMMEGKGSRQTIGHENKCGFFHQIKDAAQGFLNRNTEEVTTLDDGKE